MRILPTNIDELQIEINAKATKANDAIDRLVLKLDRLTTSLGKMNTTNLNGLANGVQRLGNAMQIMNGVKTADFTRLAKNLQKLGTINVSSLNSAASSMSHLTRAFNNLGTVSNNAQQVGVMAGNLAKLGSANVQRAVTTIPQLATAMNNLMTTLSRAPQVSQNVIQLTNSLANLASQGSRVGTAADSINRNLNATNRTVRSSKASWGGFASVIGRFYASCFLAIRGVKALGASIQSTADYFEAFNYFNVALGKIGKDSKDSFTEELGKELGIATADEYADSFATRLQDRLQGLSGLQITDSGTLDTTGLKNLGLNIQEITQYSAQLASVTNSIGQTGEVSLATASALTKLGSDMSSLFNMDYSQVMNNLTSGILGQSRALYKYGLDITAATLQTKAYELGIEKAVSEMTQAEKQQLRLLLILEGSKVAWGDQSNTINSLANQMRILENNMQEVSLVLGQLFVPLMENALPVINGLTRAIKNLLVNMAGILGIKIDPDKFGKGFTEIEDNFEGITEGTEEAEKALEEYKNQLLGFDEVNKLQDVDATATLDTEQGAGFDITQEILDATEEYEKFWQEAFAGMEDYSTKWEKYFSKIVEPIEELFSNIKIGDWFEVGGNVAGLGYKITDFLKDAVNKVNWSALGKFVGKFLSGALVVAFGGTGTATEFVFDVAEGIAEGIGSAVKNISFGKIALSLVYGLGKSIKEATKGSFDVWNALVGLDNGSKYYELDADVIANYEKAKQEGKDLTEYLSNMNDTLLQGAFGQYAYLDIIANKYLDLASKASLTVDEESKLAGYREELIKSAPELAEILNDEKVSYEQQADAINKVIDNLKKKALQQAAQNKITELYETQLQQAEELAKAEKEASKVNQKRTKIEKERERVLKNLENAQRQYDETFETDKEAHLQASIAISEYKGKLAELDAELETVSQEQALANRTVNEQRTQYLKTTEQIELYADVAAGVKSANDIIISSSNGVIETFEDIEAQLVDTYGGIKTAFGNNWDSMISQARAKMDEAFSGIKYKFQMEFDLKYNLPSGSTTTAENIASYVIGATEDDIEELNKLLAIKNKWGIGKYATGGFPEDGLFFANHNELVGKFSNGRTAVANNAQIVEGIKSGVYDAVTSAIMSTGGNGSNVTVVLQGDADNLFRVVQSKADSYTMQTGRPAFII